MIKTFVALGLNSGIVYVAGFGFWILCAKVFSPDEVGNAVAFFALINTAASFGLLGLNTVLIRFLARSTQRAHLVGQSLFLTGVTTLISVVVINTFFVKTSIHPVLFTLGAILTCWNALSDNILLGLGKSEHLVVKNIIGVVFKLLILVAFMLTIQTASGPIWAIVLGAAASVGWMVLLYRDKLSLVISQIKSFKDVTLYKGYAIGSYVSNVINSLPGYVVPVLVSNYYQYAGTAHYFMAANVANTAFIIPQLTTTSLFSEGSRNEAQLHRLLLKATRLTFLALLPLCVVLFVWPTEILQIFGSSYSHEGALVLRLFALSGPFVGINYLAGTWLYLRNKIRTLVIINIWQTSLLLGLTVALLKFGIWGAGLAALLTQVVTSGSYGLVLGGLGNSPKSFLNQLSGLIKKLTGQKTGPKRKRKT